MSTSWIYVNPILDRKTGEFLTLKNYKPGEKIKPNPFNGADPGKSQKGEEKKFTFSSSSNLEIASIGGINSSLGSTTFIHDSLIYRISRAPIVNGSSLVKGTWWGFGMRLKVVVKNVQFGLNVSWASVAASVQLGYAEAEFEIESIGIADSEIFELLPNPTDLTIESLNSILDAGNEIRRKYNTADPNDVTYQPIRIEVPDSDLSKVDPIFDDRNLIFTYRQIANRRKLADARKAAIDNKLDPKLVSTYYQKLGITDPKQKPSPAQKRKAERWLSI